MAVEFQISGSRFVEVLQARLRAVRPCLSNSIPVDGEIYHVAWIDVGDAELAVSDQGTGYILNELIGGDVTTPQVGGIQVLLNRLLVLQDIQANVCSRTDMKASNNSQAPTIGVTMQLEFELLIRVNPEGRPRLCVELNDVHNIQAPVDEETKDAVVALLQSRIGTCIPLSIRPLAQVTGEATPRVFNAGIAAKPDFSAVCVRFEIEPPDADAQSRWQSFFGGDFTDRLHGRDWSLLIPEGMMETAVAAVMEENMKGNSKFSLQPSINATWAPWGDLARMVITFQGEIIDACVGIDLDVDVSITVLFTSPQPNTLRTSLVLSWDGAFWEEFACELVTALFWPIVGILFISEGKIDWEHYFGGLAAGPAILFFGMVGYLSSDDPASNVPAPSDWVKDSDTEWHQDQQFPDSVGGISGLSMDLAAADPEGLILAGAITLEEPLIPELKTFPQPFDEWRLSRPCHSLASYQSEASIGIVADPMGVNPRLRLPLCGVRVLSDPTGFYSDTTIPGGSILNSTSFQVRVKNPPAAFAQSPHDLEVLIFSNQGCRLITIAAPANVPSIPEDPQARLLLESAWLAWKATHCWRFQSVWDHLNVVNPEWLIDPPPEEIFAQHWWIQTTHNAPGDRVALVDDLGRELMATTVGDDGRAQVSGIIENASSDSAVWLSKNGAHMSASEYQARTAALPMADAPPEGAITIKQTLLHLQSEFGLAEAVEAMGLDYSKGRRMAFLKTASGLTGLNLDDPGRLATVRVLGDQENLRLRDVATGGEIRSARLAKSDERKGCASDSQSESSMEAAQPEVRPWYVGGARLGRLYARLDRSRKRLRVYRIVSSRVGTEPLPTLREIRRASKGSKSSLDDGQNPV